MTKPVWQPQPGPQKALIDCPHAEIFYGGARGGGKTDGVLGKWALKESRYGRAFNAIMFRKTTTSADDAIDRAKEILLPLGAKFNEQRLYFRMPNGGRMAFRYLEKVSDADQYQGRNVTDAWVEEAGQYANPAPIDRLNAVLRSPHGVPTQLILTANPGGAGQHWLSERYNLYPLPDHPTVVTRTLADGDLHKAAVIPSRVWDNKLLLQQDPGYIRRLKMSGSESLVRAWLEGDWSAIEGAFFDCWSTEKHVTRPVALPERWNRFRSMDWGSAAPFSVGWWAVATDDYEHPDGFVIPRNSLIRYREWYGASEPNVGVKMPAEDVGAGIAERESEDPDTLRGGVLDPAAFAEDGGPSIWERIENGARQHSHVLGFRKADNKRIASKGALGGWDQMRKRLIGRDGRPLIYCFNTCKASVRTIPTLQHDEKRPEDLDTDSEDHVADEWRYACMSRPWTAPKDEAPKMQDRWSHLFDGDEAGGNWKVL
jgi:hypothetical protein